VTAEGPQRGNSARERSVRRAASRLWFAEGAAALREAAAPGGFRIREATGELRPAAAPTSSRVAARAQGAPRFDVAGALWTLLRTDFKVRYHGTFAGFGWAMLKPLAMFAVLMSVFTFVFANRPDYALDLVLGLFLYEHFQESTRTGLVSLHAKGYLIGRSRFPR